MKTKLIVLVKTVALAGTAMAALTVANGTSAQTPGLAAATPTTVVAQTTVTPDDGLPWGG
ncbi:hypothetical protein DN069_13940 [Streptacidiphilus pinicola]|uniref:Uncharacterized protein n=1 Tax=Streptacidiphilus pinicola TaxID=2219663 RepID=A0A2X0K710_9ACTN|nr:hypothetical protein [Streptacidiphilus pinicola]RAG85055.1 hypothetical protein DN069_13940 [Streptacidiphilus pinicola]